MLLIDFVKENDVISFKSKIYLYPNYSELLHSGLHLQGSVQLNTDFVQLQLLHITPSRFGFVQEHFISLVNTQVQLLYQ